MPSRHLSILGLALLALLLIGPARALAHGTGPQQTVDGYLLTLVVPEKGWYTGPNPVEVILWDAAGSAVDATVSVAPLAYAPASGGHSETHSEAEPADNDAPAPEDAHAADAAAHSDGHATTSETHGAEGATHADSHAASAEGHTEEHSSDGQGLASAATPLTASDEPDVYAGELSFDRPGSWTVGVVFVVDGQEHGTTFEFTVAQSRPRALVLGGFALVNGLAIATAAVLKRRTPVRPASRTARSPLSTTSIAEEQPR